MAAGELDVRDVPKPQRHPMIFERFTALGLGESFVLVNNHDPKHLRQEFDRDYPDGYGWDYLSRGPHDSASPDRLWRIRITRRGSTALPRVLCDAAAVGSGALPADAAGAVWTLEPSDRQLDANIVHLGPSGRIDDHAGPDLDVLLHVLAGHGQLRTEAGDRPLAPGALVWLPRRSRRGFVAGPQGLSYLTVHRRRPALSIATAPAAQAGSGAG
jgi:uncharacterized protein (DUF2249 family)